MMGVMLDNINQVEDALKQFQRAKRYNPGSDIINLKIALEYIKLNQPTKAIDELNHVLELNPDNLQARTLLAFLYTSQGQYELAEIQYEIILTQASQDDPENLAVHHYLGQLYFQQKKMDKALEQFKFILGLEPKNIEAKLFVGLIYDEQGLRQQAIDEFRQVLEINPEDPDALNALGYIYAEEGINLREAEELIIKALEQRPNSGAYIDSLGWVYFKQGKLEQAREKLEQAASIVEDAVIFDHTADAYLALGEEEKAREVWRKALKLESADEEIKEKIRAKIKAISDQPKVDRR